MKKKEIRGLLILVVVAVIIIGILYFVTRPKESATSTGTNSGSETKAQEYTKVEEDGTIVNTSEKLKENKETDGFAITNIKFQEKNGQTILTARVTNKTGSAQESFFGDIVLLDKKGNETGRIPVMISETQAGEAIDIEAIITESYSNAYNFKLEK